MRQFIATISVLTARAARSRVVRTGPRRRGDRTGRYYPRFHRLSRVIEQCIWRSSTCPRRCHFPGGGSSQLRARRVAWSPTASHFARNPALAVEVSGSLLIVLVQIYQSLSNPLQVALPSGVAGVGVGEPLPDGQGGGERGAGGGQIPAGHRQVPQFVVGDGQVALPLRVGGVGGGQPDRGWPGSPGRRCGRRSGPPPPPRRPRACCG